MRDWNKEPGKLIFRRHYGPDFDTNFFVRENSIEIIQADPVVWANRELLEEVTLIDSPWVKFDGTEFIYFVGRNRTVIYRICEYDPMYRRYVLRWPD